MTFPRIQKIHRKTPGVPFMEQPQDHRFFVRDLITLFGGRIEAYTRTGGFHLAFPADPQDRLALIRVLKHLGWGPKVVHCSLRDARRRDDPQSRPIAKPTYFPIGADDPPEHLRHHHPNWPPSDQDRPAWYYGANFVEIKDDETTDQPDALVS